jgi:hypothetical protein
VFRHRLVNKGLSRRVLTQEEVRNPPYLYSLRILIPFMSQVVLYSRLNKLVKGRLLAIQAMQVKDRQEKIGWMEDEQKMTELLVGHSSVLLQTQDRKSEARVKDVEGKWAELDREELAREWADVDEEMKEGEKVPAAKPAAKKEESSDDGVVAAKPAPAEPMDEEEPTMSVLVNLEPGNTGWA